VTFVLAWVAFPVLLAGLGVGWGLLVEELSGARLASGALLIPVGLAAGLIVAALLTTNAATARLAVPVDGLLALIGVVRGRRLWRDRAIPRWSLVAAVAVLLVYGAPVLATGTVTFTGFFKLDDTATWLGLTAHLFSDGRSTAGLDPSSYKVLLDANLGTGAYPVGAFMLLGVGRALLGIDAAWAFQPYVACAGAALALCLYALCEGIVAAPRMRALVAFLAAQPALLYGYSLWGGIKELTAAFLVALIAALVASGIGGRPTRPRAVLPLAVATAALVVTFGPGTAVWVLPGLGCLAAVWVTRVMRSGDGALRQLAGTLAWLVAATVGLALPVVITLSQAVSSGESFTGGSAAASVTTRLGTLRAPLGAFEAAGIWPVSDFRDPLGSGVLPIALIAVVLAAALGALWASARSRDWGVVLYLVVAVSGCLAIDLAGGVPWVVGKALAIASPAVLFAGVLGGTVLFGRQRLAGGLVIGLIAGGVLWSNTVGYLNATLAPTGPLSDLAQIGGLVRGEGPTFVDDFNVYADRYFLRAGDPVDPAEPDPVPLPLTDGTLLMTPAVADLDSFPVSTLSRYRSIVTTSSPTASRPSSLYHLRWTGRYYELWQRAARPAEQVLAHIASGDSATIPYCGAARRPDGTPAAVQPICGVQPVGIATCPEVRAIAAYAKRNQAEVVAAERPPNIYARGNQVERPPSWGVTPAAESITALDPGVASAQFRLVAPARYTLWLGGSFDRGFDVAVDGRGVGRVRNHLSMGYAPVGDLALSAGLHTLTLSHPGTSLAPGSGDDAGTTLAAIVLGPIPARDRLATLTPQTATKLCGTSVDWIEVVKAIPAAGTGAP